jgi:hypothetical protein
VTTNIRITLKDCKIAPTTVMTVPATQYSQNELFLTRSHSGTNYYRNEKITFSGTLTTDAAVYMTGGAADGGTNVSWKIATTANAEGGMPFVCPALVIWNEATGSPITLTIEGGIAAAATNVPNSDIWMEVVYPGTASSTLGAQATTGRATLLAASSNYAAGAGTWNGGVVNSKFKMQATFTPQVKGPLTVYIKAAGVSGTWYIDPKPVLS